MQTSNGLMLAAGLVCCLAAGACSSGSSAPSAASGSAFAAPTPKDAVARAALVLDVRTVQEFDGGHLPQAVNIPVDEVESRLQEISAKVGGDKSKPIAVYCASGRRADSAKAALEKAGYTQVTNAGGYAGLK